MDMDENRKEIKPIVPPNKPPPDYFILLIICVQIFNLPHALEIHSKSSHASIAFISTHQALRRMMFIRYKGRLVSPVGLQLFMLVYKRHSRNCVLATHLDNTSVTVY